MIVPDKITPYKESIISKMPLIIESLILYDKSPATLWQEIQNKFEDVNEFILTLDIAFVLGTIKYLKDKQVIRYVKADNM